MEGVCGPGARQPNVPVFAAFGKASHSIGVKTSAGPVGFLLSRTPTRSCVSWGSLDAIPVATTTTALEPLRSESAAERRAPDCLVTDFGADTDVSLPGTEPDRIGGWFTFV